MDLSKIKMLQKNKPAEETKIDLAMKQLGVVLPKIYYKLLNEVNGFINEDGIGLYSIEELVERNETWEVNKYAEGYVAIGDDGGGKVCLMKCDFNSKEVIAVDCGYMNPKDNPEIITTNFEEWVSQGCQIEISNMENDKSYISLCDVIIEREPDGGMKDLLKIKKILASEIGIVEIAKGMKQPPFRVIKNMTYAKAVSRIEKLGSIAGVLKIVPSIEE